MHWMDFGSFEAFEKVVDSLLELSKQGVISWLKEYAPLPEAKRLAQKGAG